jgi:hypothetical protein
MGWSELEPVGEAGPIHQQVGVINEEAAQTGRPLINCFLPLVSRGLHTGARRDALFPATGIDELQAAQNGIPQCRSELGN